MYYIDRRYIHNDPTTFFVIWEVKSIAPTPPSGNIVRIVFVKKIKDDYNEFMRADRIVDDKKRIVPGREDVIKEIFK